MEQPRNSSSPSQPEQSQGLSQPNGGALAAMLPPPPPQPLAPPVQSLPKTQASQATSMTAVSSAPAQSTPTPDSSGQNKIASPKASAPETLVQEQITALLNLNNVILREVQKLQAAGAANQSTQPSPQQPNAPLNQQSAPDPARETQGSPAGAAQTPTSTTPTPQTPKNTKPSPKIMYDHYLKRVQHTIAYLLALSHGKPVPPHPQTMEPPPVYWFIPGPGESAPEDAEQKGRESFNDMKEAYQRLKDLWPSYKGQQAARSQQQQMQHGAGSAQATPGTGQSMPRGISQPQVTPQLQSQGSRDQQASQTISPPPQQGSTPNPS